MKSLFARMLSMRKSTNPLLLRDVLLLTVCAKSIAIFAATIHKQAATRGAEVVRRVPTAGHNCHMFTIRKGLLHLERTENVFEFVELVAVRDSDLVGFFKLHGSLTISPMPLHDHMVVSHSGSGKRIPRKLRCIACGKDGPFHRGAYMAASRRP